VITLIKSISYLIIIIYFQSAGFAQSFLEFSRYNKFSLSAGIVENNYLLLSWKPVDNINIVFNNSIFIEKFKYQNFYFKLYYRFYQIEPIKFFVSPDLSGSYNEGVKNYHLIFAIESAEIINTILAADIITSFTTGKNIYYRIGLQYSFSKNFKTSLRYGLPAFNFPDDDYFATGIEFIDNNLTVEVLIHFPSGFDNLRYSRFTTSFLINIL
jgi:hypothetical protein